MAHHVAAVARARPAASWSRHALDELPREPRGDSAQRGTSRASRRAVHKARRWSCPARCHRGHHRAEIPVMGISGSPRSRCSPWAATGSRPRARTPPSPSSTPPRRSRRPAASPSSWRGSPTRWPARSPTRSTCRPSASVRGPHRRPGAGLPRPARLGDAKPAKFVRRYADLRSVAAEAIAAFASDVRSGDYPSDEESYHTTADLGRAFDPRGRHRLRDRPGPTRLTSPSRPGSLLWHVNDTLPAPAGPGDTARSGGR